MRVLALVGLVATAQASVLGSSANQASEVDMQKNPIRKVVTMLQSMQKKIAAEAEAEEELYKKFMCYCKTGAASLDASIAANDAKIPEVESMIQASTAEKAQLDEDLKKHKSDREAAKAAMAEATSLRGKEAAAFAKEKSEADANTKAITAAVAAIEKGMASSFLQSGSAQTLRKLALSTNEAISDDYRQTLMAFLQGSQGSGYAPQSGEIVGILKEIGGEMAQGLADAIAAEDGSIANFDALMAAKTKEVAALTQSIEEKSVRTGEVAVAIANAKNDLDDSESALLEDKKFLADMQTNCDTKDAEWAEISKTRADEAVALAETIKILQDDDALELFKKTLPSASSSLLQVKTSTTKLMNKALEIVQAARKNAAAPARHQLDFIALALHGKGGFDKVIKMIDDMVALLKKEQTDDDAKKTYCAKELDEADDTKKGFEQALSDSESAAADAEESIAQLASEIKALEEGIKALDKSVAEATENRKEEHDSTVSLVADNNAAKGLLGMAKNRLNKFYNPKLYVAPPKRELSLVQISSHREAPAPPPDTFSAYSSKGQETTGVIAMIDLLEKDLDKEITEAETDEKNAQSEYEQTMADAADKRAADSASVGEKQGAKADTEAALQTHKDAAGSAKRDLASTAKYIGSLHGECDWLIQYFDVRKEARASEAGSLANAKSVLSGADYSMLVQVSANLRGAVRA